MAENANGTTAPETATAWTPQVYEGGRGMTRPSDEAKSNVVRLDAYRPSDPNPDGYREGKRWLWLNTQHEHPKYREIAARHNAARKRLNALLPSKVRRLDGPVVRLGDHLSYESKAVQAALDTYHDACFDALRAPNPKLRRILNMIRCAAELIGAPDPSCRDLPNGGFLDPRDQTMALLYRQVFRALRTEKLARSREAARKS
jgi:hypothetical protein